MIAYWMMCQQEYLWGWQNDPESNAISWCENYPEIYDVGDLTLWTNTQRNLMLTRGFTGVPDFEREYEYTLYGYAFDNEETETPQIANDPAPELQISDYVDATGFSSWDWCCCFVRKYYLYYTVTVSVSPVVTPDLIFSPWSPSENNTNNGQLTNLLASISGIRVEKR